GLHRGAGALELEAVVEDAVEHGLADEVIVVRLGGDLGGAGAEVLAAAAAGAILCVEDVQPDHLAQRERADLAVQPALAAAVPAAAGAWVGQGLTADCGDLLTGLHAHSLRSWRTDVKVRVPRTQALSVNPSITYGSRPARHRWGSPRSVRFRRRF